MQLKCLGSGIELSISTFTVEFFLSISWGVFAVGYHVDYDEAREKRPSSLQAHAFSTV
jgi:hypothetical protein